LCGNQRSGISTASGFLHHVEKIEFWSSWHFRAMVHLLRKTVSETLILFFSKGEKEAVKAKRPCASSFFLKVVSVDDDDEKINPCIFETITSLIDSSPGTPIEWAFAALEL
jgi:hypothetical protein